VKLRVWVSPQARVEIRELVAWWRENRPAAASHLPQELQRVLRLLAEAPNTGTPYPVDGIEGVRRYRLKGTPYAVYNQVDQAEGMVKVASVWSSMRGSGPHL